MSTISAIIITNNEAHNIQACIESVLWCDEIIILDSGSQDDTQDICKKYAPKVKLHETDWPGYGQQKNRAIKLATSEWLLFIDADERVTPELRDEIKQQLDKNDFVAYCFHRQTYLLNRALKHCCGKNEYVTRLAKNGYCKFSDALVHEKMVLNCKVGKLHNHLNHFSWRNLEELLTKCNLYSTLGVLQLERTQKKCSFTKAFVHACCAFFRIYFIRLGFLDGWPGFIFAFGNFEGAFYKYAKFCEKHLSKSPAKNN